MITPGRWLTDPLHGIKLDITKAILSCPAGQNLHISVWLQPMNITIWSIKGPRPNHLFKELFQSHLSLGHQENIFHDHLIFL